MVVDKDKKEREVYFRSKGRIGLSQYLKARRDTDPALFFANQPFTMKVLSRHDDRIPPIGANRWVAW